MQIIIDIPHSLYENLKKIQNGSIACKRILNCVREGTPLPKGHGRLIDADELEKDMVNGIRAGLYEEGYETFAHINDMDDCVECVKYAQTIIEADKAESEE